MRRVNVLPIMGVITALVCANPEQRRLQNIALARQGRKLRLHWRHLLLLIIVCSVIPQGHAQTVSLMPVPKHQFFDASGNPLSGGKLYTYSSGSTSPLATYTDSTGATANANPVILDAEGRADIWLSSSAYKIVLTDSADVTIWTVDNVTTATGGAASGPFTTVTSAGTNPATAGWIRAASSDQWCWRNAGNSANICWEKDANDRLNWGGIGVSITEGAAPSGTAGLTVLYGDSTAHRLKMSNNNGAFDNVVGAATTDTLTNKTLTSPLVTTGITNTGTGFKHVREASCTTAASADSVCNTTVTWPGTAFADTSYTASCTLDGANDARGYVVQTGSKTTTTILVRISNGTQAVAVSGTVNCVGIHD